MNALSNTSSLSRVQRLNSRHGTLERKDKTGQQPQNLDAKAAFDDFMRTFEAFKVKNDERLAELEKKGGGDVVTKEHVDRINAELTEQKKALDDAIVALKRPAKVEDETKSDPRVKNPAEAKAHRMSFDRFMRKGDEAGLRDLEQKALTVGTDPDGGYLATPEMETTIDRVISQVSPIRQLATVRQIGASVLKKPFNIGGTASGWVGETGARPQTNASTLKLLEYPTMELYAMPAATQTLLDDAYINIDQWVADEVAIEFAEQEGAAFVSGDGVAKPHGFLAYDTVADANWAWGKIGYVASGASGAFAGSNPSDKLIDLVYAPKAAFRANAQWVMNRKTEAEIRKFKDSTDNYLWQPGLQAGQPATLLGYPITEAEDMPDLAANSLSLAFGDFRRGYLIVDRIGVRILRDPFTAKPYVLFYTTKRVGGGVQNYEAIKLMKFAAS